MQHLDEGTIHSWLDGALSADEAARVEAHVAECPQCASAVAEARGFIAASSRILTALDNVPRGVVPAATPIKWYNRASWRAAAAVLVVAVGSLVVVSNGGRSKFASSTVAPAMSGHSADSQVAGTQPQTMAASPGPTASKLEAPPTATPVGQHSATASRTASSIKPTTEAEFSAKQVGSVAQGNAVTRKQPRVENLDAAIGANAAAAPQAAGAVTATVQSNLSGRVSGVVVTDSTAPEPVPLRAVGHPRLIGATVTLYEVAPGDTVTFTEPSNVQLESVVVTGLSVPESKARRSVEKSAPTANSRRSDTVTAAASDSQSPRILLRAISVSPTGQPPLGVEVVNGVTIISWPDATTGNMLKLSGRMSVNRLKQIKLRIERERAAQAAKKKP